MIVFSLSMVSRIFMFGFLYDFRIGIQKLQTLKIKTLLNTLLLICMLSVIQTLVRCNDTGHSRQIRSPTGARGNLKLCNSAFVNFPAFKARGCPPPRFCSLSVPLKKRYCVKANVPASKRNSFYFPKESKVSMQWSRLNLTFSLELKMKVVYLMNAITLKLQSDFHVSLH